MPPADHSWVIFTNRPDMTALCSYSLFLRSPSATCCCATDVSQPLRDPLESCDTSHVDYEPVLLITSVVWCPHDVQHEDRPRHSIWKLRLDHSNRIKSRYVGAAVCVRRHYDRSSSILVLPPAWLRFPLCVPSFCAAWCRYHPASFSMGTRDAGAEPSFIVDRRAFFSPRRYIAPHQLDRYSGICKRSQRTALHGDWWARRDLRRCAACMC